MLAQDTWLFFFFGQACIMDHHVHSSKSRMNVLQPFLFVVFRLKPWKASLGPLCFDYQFKQWSSQDLICKYKQKWFSKEHPQRGTSEVSERSTESHSWLYYTKYCSLIASNLSGSHLLSSCSHDCNCIFPSDGSKRMQAQQLTDTASPGPALTQPSPTLWIHPWC